MNRRYVLLELTLLALWPGHGEAQAAKLPRVAFVFTHTPLADMTGAEPASRSVRAFMLGLRNLGYVEGGNVLIDRRSADGRPERLPALMHDVIALKVDVIVGSGQSAGEAARATASIPVVAIVEDPVAVGLADSLVRPGRNVTGVTTTPGPDVLGKQLQVLRETLPSLRRVGVIDFKYVDSKTTPGTHLRRAAATADARGLGLEVVFVGVNVPQDFDNAFDAIRRSGVQALLVGSNAVNQVHQQQIIDFAIRQRLPTIAGDPEYSRAGGLMSYGASTAAIYALAAEYVDKVFRGAKPAELPFQQPTRFEFALNLKTARALGLSIPRAVLVQVDAFVE